MTDSRSRAKDLRAVDAFVVFMRRPPRERDFSISKVLARPERQNLAPTAERRQADIPLRV
jgi:hypothetical protein